MARFESAIQFRYLLYLGLVVSFLLGCSPQPFKTSSGIIHPESPQSDSSDSHEENPEPTNTQPPTTPTEEIPAGASFSKPTNGKGGAKGDVQASCPGRNIALHVPAGYSDLRPTAIVVAMHGLGDNYQNFNEVSAMNGWHTLSEQKNFIYMVPSSQNSNRKSFLYFNENNSLNVSATVNEAESLLQCIYRNLGAQYNIETNEIYWIGFSEGASFTAFTANYLSRRLKGVAIYGGSAPRNSALVQRQLPIYFLTGLSDYGYEAIRASSEQWISHPHQRHFVQASHSFSQLNSQVSAREVFNFISQAASSPVESGF